MIFLVRDPRSAGQKIVHLFTMSPECTQCERSEDYAPQTAYDQGTVVDYVSHITVDCELAPQFFDDLKADRLYNDN